VLTGSAEFGLLEPLIHTGVPEASLIFVIDIEVIG
jgi:hypothetical protein